MKGGGGGGGGGAHLWEFRLLRYSGWVLHILKLLKYRIVNQTSFYNKSTCLECSKVQRLNHKSLGC